jgi:hypothetical protein
MVDTHGGKEAYGKKKDGVIYEEFSVHIAEAMEGNSAAVDDLDVVEKRDCVTEGGKGVSTVFAFGGGFTEFDRAHSSAGSPRIRRHGRTTAGGATRLAADSAGGGKMDTQFNKPTGHRPSHCSWALSG